MMFRYDYPVPVLHKFATRFRMTEGHDDSATFYLTFVISNLFMLHDDPVTFYHKWYELTHDDLHVYSVTIHLTLLQDSIRRCNVMIPLQLHVVSVSYVFDMTILDTLLGECV